MLNNISIIFMTKNNHPMAEIAVKAGHGGQYILCKTELVYFVKI